MVEREAAMRACAILRVEDFYSAQHQMIFAVIADLVEQHQPVDIVRMQGQLGEDRLAGVGGFSYLLDLQAVAPTSAMVREYARQVKRTANLRRFGLAGYSALFKPDPERLISLVEAAQTCLESENSLEDIGMDELLATDIEVEWLVEPLIPLNGVTVIAGDSRLGKSWLALSLCHALANGFREWLGKYPISAKGGAIYLDQELGEAGMRSRLLDLDLGAGTSTPAVKVELDPWAEDEQEETIESRPLRLLFDPPIHTAQIGALEGLVRQYHARVLVLDPFADFIPPWTRLKDNDDMAKEIQRLRRFARRVRCAVILLHHRRKFQAGMDAADLGSSMLGAQTILSRPDSAIFLTGRPDGPRILSHDKARLGDYVERPFYLEKAANEHGRGALLLHGGSVQGDVSEKADLVEEVVLTLLQPGRMRYMTLWKEVARVSAASPRFCKEMISSMAQQTPPQLIKLAVSKKEVYYCLPGQEGQQLLES